MTTFLPSIQQGMASTGLVPVFGHALTIRGRRKLSYEVAPRGNENLISMPPSSERLQPKPRPPSNKSFTLVAEVTTLCCLVHHQVGGCQRKSVHCFKISFSLESLLGRRQLNHVDRSPSYFHCFPKNEIPRKYAESFTDVLLRQKSDKINGENVQ